MCVDSTHTTPKHPMGCHLPIATSTNALINAGPVLGVAFSGNPTRCSVSLNASGRTTSRFGATDWGWPISQGEVLYQSQGLPNRGVSFADRMLFAVPTPLTARWRASSLASLYGFGRLGPNLDLGSRGLSLRTAYGANLNLPDLSHSQQP